MNVLIIGGAGFVGDYLLDHLHETYDWQLAATKMPHEKINKHFVQTYDLNILEPNSIEKLLQEIRPDFIFHLAAQSSVSVSWDNPVLTTNVNIIGCINVLDAIRTLDYSPRILLIGSGEEYGHVKPDEVPITEDTTLRPGNIYAATKACQNMIGSIYASAYQMDVLMVRAFNHIGPNQTPLFVVANFCKQVADIEKGINPPIIRVGNLESKRDFADVRDVVRAYAQLMLHGKSGELYNVGSGNAVSINAILELILSFSESKIQVEIDPDRFRPVDVPIIEADIQKLTTCTGWKPETELANTILETLNFWRSQ